MFLLNKFRKKFLSKNSNINTILYLIFVFFLLTVMYDTLYMSIEKMDSLMSMIYYNIVTASTVGYGDFSPQTVMGKFLTAIYIPIAISLFAALLSVLGTIIYNNIHRRDNGLKSISKEIDYLIIGGFKEKLDEIIDELVFQDKKVALINDHYESIPISYKKDGVVWIKGDVVSDSSLTMFDHSKIKSYVVLNSKPTKLSSDMKVLYTLEKLLSYVDQKSVMVEVVEPLNVFPMQKNIRYLKIIKGRLIAKEVLKNGILTPVQRLLDNNEKLNQYNLITTSTTTWGKTKEAFDRDNLKPIGYLDGDQWLFFPLDSEAIEEGSTIKVITSSTNPSLSVEKIEQKILIIGDNKMRIDGLKKDYLLDERYSSNSLETIDSIETEILNFKFKENYTHILILAEPEKVDNDTINFFYWKFFRTQFPHTKIITELVNSTNREELEKKYEDSKNEFVSISQIGLMVQELQDDGIIHLVENLSNQNLEMLHSVSQGF